MADGRITAHDGVSIAYRDYGGVGRGLVLLHGVGANLVSMDQYAARLGSGRRTISMDARACGQSDDPEHVRLIDMAADVRTVAEVLDLGPIDVVGHSMGGFVAGFYAGLVDDARVVSIDGFGPGTVGLGTDEDRRRFRQFQSDTREAFWAMTAPPERGDRAWRDRQVDALVTVLPAIGYTAPNVRSLAERHFVELDDGPRVQVERLSATHLAPAWDALEDTVALVDRFFAAHPVT